MSGITVKELAAACAKQLEKGNGDKIVLLSGDDEGNSFHTLFYLFTDKTEDIKPLLEYDHDGHDVKDVVILG